MIICIQTQFSVDALAAIQGEPQLWSAEAPYLYVLVLEVVDGSEEVLERESCQVCFHSSHIQLSFIIL